MCTEHLLRIIFFFFLLFVVANVKERRALCRAEVGRALGETAELEVLTENDVGSIFQFLLDYGLPDENQSVQLYMTEAGMAMCVFVVVVVVVVVVSVLLSCCRVVVLSCCLVVLLSCCLVVLLSCSDQKKLFF